MHPSQLETEAKNKKKMETEDGKDDKGVNTYTNAHRNSKVLEEKKVSPRRERSESN